MGLHRRSGSRNHPRPSDVSPPNTNQLILTPRFISSTQEAPPAVEEGKLPVKVWLALNFDRSTAEKLPDDDLLFWQIGTIRKSSSALPIRWKTSMATASCCPRKHPAPLLSRRVGAAAHFSCKRRTSVTQTISDQPSVNGLSKTLPRPGTLLCL